MYLLSRVDGGAATCPSGDELKRALAVFPKWHSSGAMRIFRRSLWVMGIFGVALFVSGRMANSDPSSDDVLKGARSHKSRVVSDTSLLAAAVRWIGTGGLSATGKPRCFPLHVDPCPLRSDVETLTLREDAFAEVESSTLHRRSSVLQRLGVPQRDVLAYGDECLFACNPRMRRDEEGEGKECPEKRCRVTAIALSVPVKSETASYPDKSIQKTVKVLRLTPMLHFLYELTFRRTNQGWKMIEKEVVKGGGM